MNKQIIYFKNLDTRRARILKLADIFIVPTLKKLNDKRCANNGVGRNLQEQPLPGIGESIRAFFIKYFGIDIFN